MLVDINGEIISAVFLSQQLHLPVDTALDVEAEKTPSAAVRGALEVLGSSKNVGLVLNKSRSSLAGSRFGGYYSYYYKEENY